MQREYDMVCWQECLWNEEGRVIVFNKLGFGSIFLHIWLDNCD